MTNWTVPLLLTDVNLLLTPGPDAPDRSVERLAALVSLAFVNGYQLSFLSCLAAKIAITQEKH